MRWLFLALIGAFVVSDIFGLSLSLGPGLSVKNAVLYSIGFALLFRTVLHGGLRIEMPGIHLAFFLLIGYAVLTWIIAFQVIEYPNYRMFEGLITLKTRLIDPALMLFAAFYALRSMDDAKWVLGVLLLGIGVANVATLADTAGIYDFGMRVGDHGQEMGRMMGAFGHANDTGALIVCVLPAMIAMVLTTRGAYRLIWIGTALASALVLILTVSRGAFVGLFLGCILAAFLCRRYVPVQKLLLYGVLAGIGAVLAVIVAGIVDPQIGGIVTDRILSGAKATDVYDASSGRSDIWWTAISRMIHTPLSFITGFGWDVYNSMPFHYAPHNYYLGMWFNLGIVGLLLFVFILCRCVINAMNAFPMATPRARPHFLACVFGMMSLAVSILFADLFDPWSYIWLYVGVLLRMSVLVQAGEEERATVEAPEPLAVASLHAPAIREGRGAFGGVLAGRPH